MISNATVDDLQKINQRLREINTDLMRDLADARRETTRQRLRAERAENEMEQVWSLQDHVDMERHFYVCHAERGAGADGAR